MQGGVGVWEGGSSPLFTLMMLRCPAAGVRRLRVRFRVEYLQTAALVRRKGPFSCLLPSLPQSRSPELLPGGQEAPPARTSLADLTAQPHTWRSGILAVPAP